MLRRIQKVILIFLIIISIFYFFILIFSKPENKKMELITKNQIMKIMTLTSSAFENNKNILSKYTCDGENINPPLKISGVDEKARSLVLIMEDPDVPKFVREDGRWNHWLKFNLPVSVTEIKEGLEPEGLSGITTSNTVKYQGPCPPDREHRYFFKLYSLDTVLSLKEGATKETIEQAMENHILQKAVLMGRYNRSSN